MNKRQSIYVGKDLNSLVTSMQSQTNSMSGIINSIADRYSVIVKNNTPEFARDEWLELLRCLFDYDTKNVIQAVNGLAGTVAAANLTVAPDFANRINSLYFEEKLAIIHISEVFWAAGGDIPMEECGIS